MELERPPPSTPSESERSPSDIAQTRTRMSSIESDDSTSQLVDELEDGTDHKLFYLCGDNEIIPTEPDSSNKEKDNKSSISDQQLKELRDEQTLAMTRHKSKVYEKIQRLASSKSKNKKIILSKMDLNPNDVPWDNILKIGKSVYSLNLSGNSFGLLPSAPLEKLQGLVILNLQQCDLKEIPLAIFKLEKVETIDLSHNQITSFRFQNKLPLEMEQLKYLDLCDNQLSELEFPEEAFSLQNLQEINLGFNKLRKIPENVTLIKSMKTLRINNNLVEYIPHKLVIGMPNLKVLECHDNPIIQPPLVYCERGLDVIRRYYASLSAYQQDYNPVDDTDLYDVRLYDGGNDFDSDLGDTKKPVYGKKSKRRAFAQVVEKAKSKAKQTAISMKPAKMNLLQLSPSAYRKPLWNSPDKIKKAASEGLLTPPLGGQAYLYSTKEDLIQQCGILTPLTYECQSGISTPPTAPPMLTSRNSTLKLVVVGDSGVGKTSLIQCLIEGKRHCINMKENSTSGCAKQFEHLKVDHYSWDPRKSLNDGLYDDDLLETSIPLVEQNNQHDAIDHNVGNDIKFSIWECSGDGIHHSSHELFFSRHACYIVVWDMGYKNSATFVQSDEKKEPKDKFDLSDSDSDSDCADSELRREIDKKVNFWIDCIKSSIPGAVIIVVGTFSDGFIQKEEIKRRWKFMKDQVLRHEENSLKILRLRHIQMQQLKEANVVEAWRVKRLLEPLARPKFAFECCFGTSSPTLVVSSLHYEGFETLRTHIVGVATGRIRDKDGLPYFRGHVGALLPPLGMQIQQFIEGERKKRTVARFDNFVSSLNNILNSYDESEVKDTLHFLSSVGEVSFFEDAHIRTSSMGASPNLGGLEESQENMLEVDNTNDVDREQPLKLHITDNFSLSDYVILNPKWLLTVLTSIIRPNLRAAIDQISDKDTPDSGFYIDNSSPVLRCPTISGDEINLLWKSKRTIQKAAACASNDSMAMVELFSFLKNLLIRFGVLAPLDNHKQENPVTQAQQSAVSPIRYILPCLLDCGAEPNEIWSFKNREAHMSTLCVSWELLPGETSGLMERLTSCIIRDILSEKSYFNTDEVVCLGYDTVSSEYFNPFDVIKFRDLKVDKIFPWRSSTLLEFSMERVEESEELKRSTSCEVFICLVDHDSPMCVGSDCMPRTSKKLVVAAKGHVGNHGRKIWKGGYEQVIKCICRAMRQVYGLEIEKQAFCPTCLHKFSVGEARGWKWIEVLKAVSGGTDKLRCDRGHLVDLKFVSGCYVSQSRGLEASQSAAKIETEMQTIACTDFAPVKKLARAVVLVALWDRQKKKFVNWGSGFVVDGHRGLIVSASHIFFEMRMGKQFGERSLGCSDAFVLVGVIPGGIGCASFRYIAEVVHENITCVDACVLRIKSKLERDIDDQKFDFSEIPEFPYMKKVPFKKNPLPFLRITPENKSCEMEEEVRVIGFNQGGSGIHQPGRYLNRVLDFSEGHFISEFKPTPGIEQRDNSFLPRKELVVYCRTIAGHSGGPCVNNIGEVVGVLSRSDPNDPRRSHLVPTSEFKNLVEAAKNAKCQTFEDLF